MGRAKEPVKYERSAKGNWVLTQAWKDWRDKKRQKESQRPKSEAHRFIWREIAYDPSTGKRIFVCRCNGNQGGGCGAVAVQETRTSAIVQVIESRFS